MLLKENLSPIIIKIVSNNYNQINITYLVHISKSLAHAYLINRRYYNKLFSSINHPGEISNLAIDSIAPLFARDEYGCFYELQRFFQPLLKDNEIEESLALIHLRRIVVSKTKQELINVFKQGDPGGWRIYRNLQLAPKRNNKIGVFKNLGIKYYYCNSMVSTNNLPSCLCPESHEIPQEDLEQRLVESLKITNNTPTIVELVLKSLKKSNKYRHFVSRDKLFHSLKTVWGLHLDPFNDQQYSPNRVIGR